MGLNCPGIIFYSGGWQQILITDIEILVIFIRVMLIAKNFINRSITWLSFVS
jgi:hypothetical protein